jgi:hypothetical protein
LVSLYPPMQRFRFSLQASSRFKQPSVCFSLRLTKCLWSVWESGKNCFDYQQVAMQADSEHDESLMQATVKVWPLLSVDYVVFVPPSLSTQ